MAIVCNIPSIQDKPNKHMSHLELPYGLCNEKNHTL